MKDKYILVKMPFIAEPEIWAGFLEGLLNIELDIKTFAPPLVFEVKEKKVFQRRNETAKKEKFTSMAQSSMF